MEILFAINLNELVQVRLTKEGLAQHEKWYCDLSSVTKMSLPNSVSELKPDDDGWYSFQLWNLMQIFGAQLYQGNSQMFIGNLIRIRTKSKLF